MTFQRYSISDDRQLFRLEEGRFLEHLLADVLADGDATRAVNVETPAGKMQVLAAVEGGKEGRARQPAGPMGHPAGRPGMGMDDVDAFPFDDPPQRQNVQNTVEKATVVDGDLEDLGPGGLAEAARGDEDLVALPGLFGDEGGGRGFRTRDEVAA